MQTVDVKKYGALGDGITDDTLSIRKATAALTSGSTLYFPVGTYLIQTEGTVVYVKEISTISVHFELGAELLLDNLNEKGVGTGHAFFFQGPAEDLSLSGLQIRWKTRPARRSMGDGIRIDGPAHQEGPSDQRTYKNVTITHCRVENAPQTGMVLMGCSDIKISDIELMGTWADGVHLNACRRYAVRHVSGNRVGDDNVALVTYYHPDTKRSALGGRSEGPYAQASLSEWSNFQGIIAHVRSSQKTGANGMRIAGARNVAVTDVHVRQRKAAIIVDAGKKGNTFGWSYLASREIAISGVEADQCHVGVHIMTFNVTPANGLFWNFDVTLSNVITHDCAHDNLLVEKCSGVQLSGIHSSQGRVRLINLNNLTVNQLRQRHGNVIVHGLSALGRQQSSFNQASNLTLDSITVYHGSLQVENAEQVRGGHWAVYQSERETSISLVNLQEVRVDELTVVMTPRYGIRVIKCQGVTVKRADVTSEAKKCIPIEVGGGNAFIRTEDVTFEQVIYKNGEGKPKVLFQQGPYAPQRVSIQMEYQGDQRSRVRQQHFQLP